MPRWQRAMLAAGSALLVALLALVMFLLLVVDRAGGRIDSQAGAISALASGDRELRAQVQQLGGTPQVPPPQVIVSGVVGPAGPAGVGVAGPSGPPGPSGASVTGPSGPQGSPGVSVTGPSGPPGPQGEPGVGATGPAGAPGSPPAGWSFEVNGTTYNCTPDNGTPAPHYTCPPVSPGASASASVSPSPSGGPVSSPVAPAASASAPGLVGITPSPPAVVITSRSPLAPQAPAGGARPRSGLLLVGFGNLPLGRRHG